MGSKALKQQSVLAKRPANNVVALGAAMKAVNDGFTQMAELLSRDITPGALAAAYNIIDKDWKKVIEFQREAVRDALLQLAEKGTDQIPYNGKHYTLKVSKSKSKLPQLAPLCAKTGLTQEQLGIATVTYEADPTKLEVLVAEGKLTREDIEAARKELGARLVVEVK